MIKPQLVDLEQFKPKPPPIVMPSPKELQSSVNLYMNVVVVGVILVGCYFLYHKLRSKDQETIKYQNDVVQLSKYL